MKLKLTLSVLGVLLFFLMPLITLFTGWITESDSILVGLGFLGLISLAGSIFWLSGKSIELYLNSPSTKKEK